MKRVAILGAGSWGTALATLLSRCDSVALWSRTAALAGAIASAASDQRRREFGANARERARQFSSDIMVARTEALYKRLLARG